MTTDFPAKIREHARRMRRFYERVRHRNEAAFVKGALTPLAADLCLLDRCGRGFRVVRAAIRRGELNRRSAFDVSPLRHQLPARAEALPAPDRLPLGQVVAAEQVLDAADLVVERLAGRSRRSSSLSTV